jgi:hypothetical protein
LYFEIYFYQNSCAFIDKLACDFVVIKGELLTAQLKNLVQDDWSHCKTNGIPHHAHEASKAVQLFVIFLLPSHSLLSAFVYAY